MKLSLPLKLTVIVVISATLGLVLSSCQSVKDKANYLSQALTDEQSKYMVLSRLSESNTPVGEKLYLHLDQWVNVLSAVSDQIDSLNASYIKEKNQKKKDEARASMTLVEDKLKTLLKRGVKFDLLMPEWRTQESNKLSAIAQGHWDKIKANASNLFQGTVDTNGPYHLVIQTDTRIVSTLKPCIEIFRLKDKANTTFCETAARETICSHQMDLECTKKTIDVQTEYCSVPGDLEVVYLRDPVTGKIQVDSTGNKIPAKDQNGNIIQQKGPEKAASWLRESTFAGCYSDSPVLKK